jgi:hypothetical protein
MNSKIILAVLAGAILAACGGAVDSTDTDPGVPEEFGEAQSAITKSYAGPTSACNTTLSINRVTLSDGSKRIEGKTVLKCDSDGSMAILNTYLTNMGSNVDKGDGLAGRSAPGTLTVNVRLPNVSAKYMIQAATDFTNDKAGETGFRFFCARCNTGEPCVQVSC